MSIGVYLRTQIVNAGGASKNIVRTGDAFRVSAVNYGIISFVAEMATTVIGRGVTDSADKADWTVQLILPGSPGAKAADQRDVELIVTEPDSRVAFHSQGFLFQVSDALMAAEGSTRNEPAYYKSAALDVFGITA